MLHTILTACLLLLRLLGTVPAPAKLLWPPSLATGPLERQTIFFLPPHLKKNKLMHYCFGIWIILKFVCPTNRKIADTGATRNCSFTSYFGFPWYPLRQPSGSPFRRNPPWAPIGSNTQGASFRKISPGSPFGGFLCLTLTLSIQALARITVIKQY